MNHRAVKIIATVGPAISSEERLHEMIAAGVDLFRFNFAHETRETHAARIALVKRLAEAAGRAVGILADISGPKIRLGVISNDKTELIEGQRITLYSPEAATGGGLPVQLARFDQFVQPGDPIYLADGTRKLTAESCGNGIVQAVVNVGGPVGSMKGINLPYLRKPLPVVGEKDLLDVKCALESGADWIGLSFVSDPADARPIRELIRRTNGRGRLLAKLERRQALEKLDEIAEEFDGVMVARGDLGIEVEFEKVPVIQDRILRTARAHGKPVIVATQILTSMIHNPRPTRAEATDIAYAVAGGADALMLSDETAVGDHPVKAVETVAKVAREAEEMSMTEDSGPPEQTDEALAMAHTAAILARDIGAAAILCPTRSGNSARAVARFRPRAPIAVVSDAARVIGELTLYRGVHPLTAALGDSLDSRLRAAIQASVKHGLVQPGQRVVIVGAVGSGSNRTHLLLTHTVPGN